MSYILNIETATKNCSVALSLNGETVACVETADAGYAHAEKLHVFIEQVLEQAAITYSDLSAVAVSKGPGSYTGLRIGVSAAKGLCFALDIPLIALPTLEVLAKPLVGKVDGVIVPMLDARRMEVYSAHYSSTGELLREVEAEILDKQSYAQSAQTLYLCGDAQEKLAPLFTAPHWQFHSEISYPSARDMGRLSEAKRQANAFEDVAYFEPYYLKEFMVGGK